MAAGWVAALKNGRGVFEEAPTGQWDALADVVDVQLVIGVKVTDLCPVLLLGSMDVVVVLSASAQYRKALAMCREPVENYCCPGFI